MTQSNPYVLTVPTPDARTVPTQSGQEQFGTAPVGGGTLPVGTIVGQLLVWNGAAWTLLNPAQAGYLFQGTGVASIPAYGPPDFVIVANIAALAALQLDEVGTTAYVVTVGALWSVTASPETLVVDGITCIENFQGAPLYWLRGPSMVAPLAQQQTTWFFDGQRTDGGNDENTGLEGSPLATVAELFRRVGGLEAPLGRFGQVNVAITYLSQCSAGDSWLWEPRFYNGSTISHSAALPAAAFVGTISSITAAKSLSGNTGLIVTFTTTSGAVAENMLLVNSNRGNSMGIAQSITEASEWQIVQPMTQYTLGTFPVFDENNAWAEGDAITGYVPLSVDFGVIGGKAFSFDPSTDGPNTMLQNLSVIDSSEDGGFGTVFVDPACYAICAGCVFQRNVTLAGANVCEVSTTFLSCVFNEQMNADSPNTGVRFSACLFNAGGILRQYTMQNSTTIAIEGVIGYDSNELESNIYVAAGATFTASNYTLTGGQAGAWYGPGTLNVLGTLALGGGTAVSQIPITGLTINGATEAYSNSTTAGLTTTHLLALSAANIDNAAGSGGFGGLAYIPGVGAIQKGSATP